MGNIWIAIFLVCVFGFVSWKLSLEPLLIPQLVISCTDGTTGLEWAKILSTKFPGKYEITVVLHGKLIRLGLTGNPYEEFERALSAQGVHFVICNLCLQEQIAGIRKDTKYATSTLIDFVHPIPFSIDYIAQRVKRGAIAIYA